MVIGKRGSGFLSEVFLFLLLSSSSFFPSFFLWVSQSLCTSHRNCSTLQHELHNVYVYMNVMLLPRACNGNGFLPLASFSLSLSSLFNRYSIAIHHVLLPPSLSLSHCLALSLSFSLSCPRTMSTLVGSAFVVRPVTSTLLLDQPHDSHKQSFFIDCFFCEFLACFPIYMTIVFGCLNVSAFFQCSSMIVVSGAAAAAVVVIEESVKS